jgi:uncharacterized protein
MGCAQCALHIVRTPFIQTIAQIINERENKMPAETSQKHVNFSWAVKIPARDGVKLNATVYKPKEMKEALPVIFTFTPYIGERFHQWGIYFANNGYVFAAVDVRGRGNSEGHFEPVVNEGRDGYDVVEWFASQPYCNGKVTMFGGSYGGFDQWSTLKEFPPHLASILPVASGYPSLDFPFPGNIFTSYFMQWLTFTSGHTANTNIFGDQALWADKFYEMYTQHRPFKELDQIAGNLDTHFQTWINHHIQGPYWDAVLPKDEDYARFTCPILTITGHYDGDQNGALGYYRKHMQFGNPAATAQHYLVIGPWDHGGTRVPVRHVGGLDFGEPSMIDMDRLNKDWYDYALKGTALPAFLKQRVAYYLMGLNVWKYADSLESISNETLGLYLQSNGSANDAFESGKLHPAQPPAQSPADSYIYDPLDTRFGELELKPNADYIKDQTAALNLFGGGLVYHTAPFEADTEISGHIRLDAWISMDVPDVDFIATLYEILQDGTSIFLTQDMKRARFRSSLRQEELVQPGEIICYTFNTFTFFSRQIARGSRLRLVFASPNSIQLEKNYCSGKPVQEESGADARTAHITLHHDSAHPSCLLLPLVK